MSVSLTLEDYDRLKARMMYLDHKWNLVKNFVSARMELLNEEKRFLEIEEKHLDIFLTDLKKIETETDLPSKEESKVESVVEVEEKAIQVDLPSNSNPPKKDKEPVQLQEDLRSNLNLPENDEDGDNLEPQKKGEEEVRAVDSPLRDPQPEHCIPPVSIEASDQSGQSGDEPANPLHENESVTPITPPLMEVPQNPIVIKTRRKDAPGGPHRRFSQRSKRKPDYKEYLSDDEIPEKKQICSSSPSFNPSVRLTRLTSNVGITTKKVETKEKLAVVSKETKTKGKGKKKTQRKNRVDLKFTCTICQKKLMSQRSLKSHELTHQYKPFSCDLCDRRFNFSYSLKRHQIVHTNVKPYRCTTCGKSFFYNIDFLDHSKRHTRQFQKCPTCSKPFLDIRYFKKHLLYCGRPLPKCPKCGIEIRNPSHRKKHYKSLHCSRPNLTLTS